MWHRIWVLAAYQSMIPLLTSSNQASNSYLKDIHLFADSRMPAGQVDLGVNAPTRLPTRSPTPTVPAHQEHRPSSMSGTQEMAMSSQATVMTMVVVAVVLVVVVLLLAAGTLAASMLVLVQVVSLDCPLLVSKKATAAAVAAMDP